MRPSKLFVAALWLAGGAAATAQHIDTSQYQRRQVGTANGQPIYINVNTQHRDAKPEVNHGSTGNHGDRGFTAFHGGSQANHGGGQGHGGYAQQGNGHGNRVRVNQGGSNVRVGATRSYHNCQPYRANVAPQHYASYGGGGGYAGYGNNNYNGDNGYGSNRCNAGPSRSVQCFGTGSTGYGNCGVRQGIAFGVGFGGGNCRPFHGAASIGYANIPRYGSVGHVHRYCR